MILAMEQLTLDQGASWTEIISCLAGVAAVVVPLIIFLIKRRNK